MRLSIIVPVYNCEKYISICLNSLLNQDISKDDYEVICVDDGSVDKSAEILDDFSRIYNNIHVIHKENQGTSKARNEGIQYAKGDYLWFVDSDDIIAPNSLKTILETAEYYNLECVVFGRESFQQDRFRPKEFRSPECIDIEKDEKEIFTATSTRETTNKVYFVVAVWFMIYSRKFILENNCCFPTDMVYYEDEVFTYKCRKRLKSVGYINSIVYYHRLWNGSLSGNNNKQKKIKQCDSLCKLVDYYICEKQNLKQSFIIEESKYLDKTISHHCRLIIDLLLTIYDRNYINNTLCLLKQWKNYIFFSSNDISKKRKVSYVLGRILPLKAWFWIMWMLCYKNRNTNEKE